MYFIKTDDNRLVFGSEAAPRTEDFVALKRAVVFSRDNDNLLYHFQDNFEADVNEVTWSGYNAELINMYQFAEQNLNQ